MKLTVYVRPGCHLCGEAVELAQQLRARFGFELATVDIERDDELHRRFLEAIPVVEIDGVEVLRVDGHRHGGLERAVESAIDGV